MINTIHHAQALLTFAQTRINFAVHRAAEYRWQEGPLLIDGVLTAKYNRLPQWAASDLFSASR